MGASVKIMLSYDYCHFEISKSTDQEVTDQSINEMRKDVQRLADKAVRQYAAAKRSIVLKESVRMERESLSYTVKHYLNVPESERSPEQMAAIKKYQDDAFWSNLESSYDYDYEDDIPDWDNED